MEDIVKREKVLAAKRKVKEFNKARALVKAAENEKTGGTVASSVSANGHAHPVNNIASDFSQYWTVNNGTIDSNSNVLPAISENALETGLHQLSHETNGFIKTNADANSPDLCQQVDGVVECEQVNSVPDALLGECTKANDLLTQQLHDARDQIQRLQRTLESDRASFDEKLKRELGSLKEQLQVHIQTIGILVAEKTELQSNLSQNQRSTEQIMGERDELSGRLKASRQRVEELEKNLSFTVNKNQKLEKANKDMSKEVDRLKIDIFKLNKANDDFQQQNSELHGRLNKVVIENGTLVDEVKELRNVLEMSNLHMQQMQAGDRQKSEIDQLNQTITNLQHQLTQAVDTMNAVSQDKDQTVAKYQAYVEQMQIQSRQLQAQMNTLLNDKEHLLDQRRELELTVTELQQRANADDAEAREALTAKQALTDTVTSLTQELERVTQLFNKQQAECEELGRYVSEQQAIIEQHRDELQRFADSQVDHSKLLENMQSDKSALSRASAQNRELKSQLAELQNGFIKMSNENMELLTKLQSEQHVIKELGAKLKQREKELEDVCHTQLVRREPEVPSLLSVSLENIAASESDIGDHALLVEGSVSGELVSDQRSIGAPPSVEHRPTPLSTTNDKQLESLSAAVRFLEQERSNLTFQWKNEQRLHQQTQQRVVDLQQQLESLKPAILDGQIVSRAQFDTLQHAMKQLEEKYVRIMRDKADLYDRLEATEHQLLLMQGQTDTIGEYASLYETQRNALRQRQVLSDGHMVKMSREREELQGKLRTLQSLVIRLLSEKQQNQQADVTGVSPSLSVQPVASRNVDDTEPANEQCDTNLEPSHLVSATQQDHTTSFINNEEYKDGSKDLHLEALSSKAFDAEHTAPNMPADSELIDSVLSDQMDLVPSLATDTAQQIMHLLQEMNESNSDKPQLVSECFSVEDGATSVDSFLNLKKSWQSYFCVLLVQEQKLLYCPSELAARRDIPLARGVHSIRLGDVKKSSEEHLPTTSHLMSNMMPRSAPTIHGAHIWTRAQVIDSAYEKGTDMGSSVSRGDGEPLSVDQNEDCQSTPSRIANFFGRKILRSQLKRTKSANKLDRRVSELPAERHHTLPAAPTTCSCTSSLTRTLSLRRKLRDNRPLSSDMTDPYTESADTYSPLSSSKSQECLSASQATLQKVDLSGGGVEVRPLHSSLTDGQDYCFQLTTVNSSTLYSCRTAKERQHWIQFIRKSIHPAHEQTRRIENSLNLWILEAKHVPGKKKYFCEFYLDKALYGRTSVKAMGDILFWGERFDFSHLPASEMLTVHLYREVSKKRKKDSGKLLIGYLHVALSELKGSQAVERWFSMSSAVVGKDTRNATVPQVRLKARYMTTAVLPTILYADLIAYLQQHCQQLVDVLEPVLGIKAKDELASTLMNVMQRMNLATGFLTDIIVAEVARLDNNHLMFRGNSIATKAMETYMKLVGDKYIKDTLSDLTSIILQSSDCCEVDPAKVNGAATLSKHQESLTMYCDMIWLKIISSYHYFPRELQEVFHAVRKRCADINRADITDNLISSCIFLRCLCPAILSPSLWGLVQEFPDEKSIRTLTLIAKVIQTVANCSRFENKEYFMTFLNDFVEREVSNMKTFLHNISVEPKDSGNSFDGYIDLGRELSVLHAILSDSLNKLEDDKLISLKVILADISNHMNDPGKADKLVSNGTVLHDIFMTPSNAKQLGSSYSVNRTRSENGNHIKSRGAGKSPKYSTVEDYELVTTVDVQPTSDYLQPVVSSVLCHRPDPRADPSKVNESWNKIVSAADMVNGDYVDLISFIDDAEAHRRSMAFAAGNKPATERQFVQLPLDVQASNTVPRAGSTTNSHTRATVSGPHSSVSSRGLTFTNPGFVLPTSGYYSESVHVSRDHLSVSEVSLPRSQDSLYSRSYEKLNASFQKASYMDSVCSNCGQQREVSSTTLYTSENWQQQEVCSFCGSVWRHRHAGERVKTITSLPSPMDGFSTVSSDGRSSWRSSATPTHMKMGINSIERQRHDKSKLEYEQELLTLKDELARTQAMLAESQMKLKVAEERSQRSSESDDTVGPMRVERRRLVEPAGQRVRSLDAANSRLLAALSDLSEPHTNLLSGSIMTSTLL